MFVVVQTNVFSDCHACVIYFSESTAKVFRCLQEKKTVVVYSATWSKVLKFLVRRFEPADVCSAIDSIVGTREVERKNFIFQKLNTFVEFLYEKLSVIGAQTDVNNSWIYVALCSMSITRNSFSNAQFIGRMLSRVIYFIRSICLLHFLHKASLLSDEE